MNRYTGDISRFSAYELTRQEVDEEKRYLRSKGYSISEPVLVDGDSIGFVAIKRTLKGTVTEILFVSIVPE